MIFLFENVLRSLTTLTDISSVPDVDNVHLSLCSQLALIIVSGVMLLLVLLGLCKFQYFFKLLDLINYQLLRLLNAMLLTLFK